MTTSLPPLARAAMLGAATGIRSQAALALLARAVDRGEIAEGNRAPLSWLRHPRAAPLTGLAAIGETIGDKLPFVPARTEPAPLLGRIVLGGLVGAIVMQAQGEDAVTGTLVGGAAGGLIAVAATKLRAAGVKRTGLPDLVWGVFEDVVALGVSRAALPVR